MDNLKLEKERIVVQQSVQVVRVQPISHIHRCGIYLLGLQIVNTAKGFSVLTFSSGVFQMLEGAGPLNP